MSSNTGKGPVNDEELAQSKYKISKQQLVDLVGQYKTREFDEDIKAVANLGGADAIVEKLNSDKEKGITDEDLMDRDIFFGTNERDDLQAESCCSMLLAALDDLMLKLLIVCSIVSITAEMLLAWQSEPCELPIAWIDGFAIMVAVILVSGVGSTVDYRKELRFVEKRNYSENQKICTVIRDGIAKEVHPKVLKVGDVLKITYGMQIPVDGLVLSGSQISTDESAMTGESEEIRKATQNECIERQEDAARMARETQKVYGVRKHELPSPILQSGTSIAQGEGKFLCLMVGEASCLGQIMAQMEKRDEKTPLQEKLEEMAEDIGKLGTIFAILTFHVLMIRFIVEGLFFKEVNLFGPVPPQSEITKAHKKAQGHVKDVSKAKKIFNETISSGGNGTRLQEGCSQPETITKKEKRACELQTTKGDYPAGCTQDGCFLEYIREWFEFLIIGIVIIVVAVPEGLPLAVMISLAFSIGAMLKDDCDVKKLASCEIMGGADNICSDKTGTLTNNKMETVRMWAGEDITVPTSSQQNNINLKQLSIAPETIEFLKVTISCNVPDRCGPTDLAMVNLLTRAGEDTEKIKAQHEMKETIRFPFTSGRKRMSTVTQNHGLGGYDKRLQIKGASEIITRGCTHYLNSQGERMVRDDAIQTKVQGIISQYAKNALRTVALAYKDIQEGEHGPRHDAPEDAPIKDIEQSGFTLIAIMGIEDTVRDEVPDAVRRIQKAGVIVRMVTGDNIDTARAIAVKCNIITQEQIENENVCMEGPTFYDQVGGLVTQTDEKGKVKEKVKHMGRFRQIEKDIRVLARSRPEDKYLIVTGLRNMGGVVAVTGDGTNDAPALKKADVGFGMGIAGTDVCLEAADIIIVNDNFERIVRAAKWGRNVYDNIQRFLRFQLTVNFVALTVTFVGAGVMKQSPVNAIQLLWVNLIMDSLAAMALATGSPEDKLLERSPQNRDDYLVSRRMVKHITYGSIWQSVILMIVAFAGEYMIYEPDVLYRFDRAKSPFVYPGRNHDWDGSELFLKWHDPVVIKRKNAAAENDAAKGITLEVFEHILSEIGCKGSDFIAFPGGYSRHFTFFFNLFVIMQVVNMVCARKIHDEWNIFEGFFANFVFLGVWGIIALFQFIIITFSSFIFKVIALTWEQWLICIAISLTVLIVDFLAKFIPDRFTYAVGKDSVFDKREIAAGREAEKKFNATQEEEGQE